MAEHLTLNQEVEGSSPSAPTIGAWLSGLEQMAFNHPFVGSNPTAPIHFLQGRLENRTRNRSKSET